MKNSSIRTSLLVFAAAACIAARADSDGAAAFSDEVRQAFAASMTDVVDSVRASAIPADALVSILPLSGDKGDTVAGLLKIAVTDAGRTYVEGKTDPMWNEVVKEMAFDERNVGLLDERTLVKIGSLKATGVLLYGVVRASDVNENRVYVELELHATDVKTKTHLWGGLFAKRWYVPGADVPQGISELSPVVRERLAASARQKMVDSLKAQPKLSDVRTVVAVPLAGDEDRYCTYIARDAVVKTEGLVAKELDISSLQGARAVFRDIPVTAGDAVMYGAVRQLGWMAEPLVFGLVQRVSIDLDFQAAIERNDTHDVLWSDTIQCFDTWYAPDWFRIVEAGIVALIALIVLGILLRSVTRVR